MATQAGAGLSTGTEALPAARAAARQALERSGAAAADWAAVFITSHHRPHFASMLAEIQKSLGTEFVSGCSASGVLTGSDEIEGRPGVAVLAVRSDRVGASTFLATPVDDRPDEVAQELARQISERRNELLVLLPDPFALRPDHLLHEIGRAAPGCEIVGAASSGDPAIPSTFQFCGRNVASKAITGLHLGGDLRRTIGITQGCQPLGPPARITAGDGNVILELDDRPALEVLRSRLPPTLSDGLSRLGAHLFVGLPPDPRQDEIHPGEYLVRQLMGVDEKRRALIVAATVRPGEPLYFVLREGQSARDDLKEMLRRVGPAARDARFGFYFNCAARGASLYGHHGIDTAYISSALGDLPIVGFFGNAEIAPLRGQNRVFTYTGVLVLIGEEPAPVASSDPAPDGRGLR